MTVRRAIAVMASVVTLHVLTLAPAMAANYPPGNVGGTGVAGTKSGTLNGGSTLPQTGGFDFTILGLGLAVLLMGVVLMATTYRRTGSDDS